jgi:hypothetical protein
MNKITLLLITLFSLGLSITQAQTYGGWNVYGPNSLVPMQTIRPNPFGQGWNVYGPNGLVPIQTIRPNPFGGGWNVYGPNGLVPMQTIRPNPFGY